MKADDQIIWPLGIQRRTFARIIAWGMVTGFACAIVFSLVDWLTRY